MHKLLIANFSRIKKNKLFWCLCGVMALASLVMILNALSRPNTTVDNAIAAFVIPIELAVAVFVSIFLGTEYGDGTIRNKLIIGHTRQRIYLANLTAALTCTAGLFASYMLPVLLIGFPGLGLPSGQTVKIIAVGFVTLMAYCALFTMISTIYANKAGATAVNLVLAFVLLVAGIFLTSYLLQPEYIPAYGIGNELEYVHNPHYVAGARRILLQILTNILPGGQATQFLMNIIGPLWTLPLYSAGICVACTTVGMIVFGKKDIK